jgi:hypothetical protein
MAPTPPPESSSSEARTRGGPIDRVDPRHTFRNDYLHRVLGLARD